MKTKGLLGARPLAKRGRLTPSWVRYPRMVILDWFDWLCSVKRSGLRGFVIRDVARQRPIKKLLRDNHVVLNFAFIFCTSTFLALLNLTLHIIQNEKMTTKNLSSIWSTALQKKKRDEDVCLLFVAGAVMECKRLPVIHQKYWISPETELPPLLGRPHYFQCGCCRILRRGRYGFPTAQDSTARDGTRNYQENPLWGKNTTYFNRSELDTNWRASDSPLSIITHFSTRPKETWPTK
jgi:hypothetical protein